MTKRTVLAEILLFSGLLTIAGCGSGNGTLPIGSGSPTPFPSAFPTPFPTSTPAATPTPSPTGSPTSLSAALLSGGGTASGTTTRKRWHTIFLKVNGEYIGTGSDQPCPVEVDHRNGANSTSCDPNNFVDFRSDGFSRDGSSIPVSVGPFNDLWSFNGSVLSTTTITDNSSGDRVVATYSVTDEGTVNGKRRLRIRTLSETEPDGVTLRPGEVGFEFVIEEVSGVIVTGSIEDVLTP